MADLNRDGRVDIEDSKIPSDEIESLLADEGLRAVPGRHGLSIPAPPRIRRLSTSTSAARPLAGKGSGSLTSDRRARESSFVCRRSCAARRGRRRYPVLAHEANIDALWETSIRPLLARRVSARDAATRWCRRAPMRYGGAVIQDLGYYPFGSHFFSNLRTTSGRGDFVEALIREAHDVNEYAVRARRARALHRRQRRPSRRRQPRQSR